MGVEIPARLPRRQIQLDHRRAVGQHRGDAVARLQSEGAQAVHQPVRRGQQLARGDLLGRRDRPARR